MMLLWIAHDPYHLSHVFTKIFKVLGVKILVSFVEEVEDIFIFLIWTKVFKILILRLKEILEDFADVLMSKKVI
jgi:hypothetical protein